ncbi:NLR family CARD domain-containing protein 4-like [Diadema setosum]|uniref:NLR family CARD domain-containing protein 4-like n=1 Tax=Diadema setosum TaxID=31175 RepID=UPI003B39FE6D
MAAEQTDNVDALFRDTARTIHAHPDHNRVIDVLGKRLGYHEGDIENFKRTNCKYHENTSDGTISMLRKWSETVSRSSVQSLLTEALRRTVEECRTSGTHKQSESALSGGEPKDLTDDEVLQLKEELRIFYRGMYSNVRVSPLYRESAIQLEDVYTNLAMFSEGMNGKKTNMNYDEFIEHLENISAQRNLENRIALFGEAGVGKTTFLAKLTMDWAMGRCLEKTDLVFLIHLRDIETKTCFGDIIMGKISDELELDTSRVEEHIRKKQRQVLILFDGLDEYGKDISEKSSSDDIIAVIRGEKFKSSPVVVTARPWKAKEIKSDNKIEKRYRFIEVQGFSEDNVISYISKFFPNNKEARDGLIELMTDPVSLVAQNMKPYPIYCSMFCYIWHDERSRTVIQGLTTFAQLFRELINQLIVHYAGKEENQRTQGKKLNKGEDCLTMFAKDALNCLLENMIVFEAKDLETSEEKLKTVCEIGILTKDTRFVCCREKNRRITKSVIEYRIPHKLFQEYLAGMHLASLYESNREEFDFLMSKLLDKYRLFEYVFYFTVGQNKDVGRAVLVSICESDDVARTLSTDQFEYSSLQKVIDFIVDVAFECNETDAIEPVIPVLNEMTKLAISGVTHTARAWTFVWKACGYMTSSAPSNPSELLIKHSCARERETDA